MAEVLWSKGEELDQLMHSLTVGNDPQLDREIAGYDCLASAAHAKMLHKQALLTASETQSLLKELQSLYLRAEKRELDIPPQLEDAHTVIENTLVEKLGETGRKIHTGRSRNDQVLVATRLLIRSTLLKWLGELVSFTEAATARFESLKDIPIPGYTHLQPAMPSSVGLWLQSQVEPALGLLREGLFLLAELNACPLGAAAGFGSSIPLDRAYTAKLLSFSRVQRNPIDCNNSRGRYEEKALRWAVDVASLFEKLACDVSLYMTREFAFFSLPAELTTGSSIMPQKRNPDLVELLRGRAAKLRGAQAEITALVMKLPSSYHRDFQYTKEPFLRAAYELELMFEMATLIVQRFEVNQARTQACLYPDIYATYQAYRLVKSGMPFRDAYIQVAAAVRAGTLATGDLRSDFGCIAEETAQAASEASTEMTALKKQISEWQKKVIAVPDSVFSL